MTEEVVQPMFVVSESLGTTHPIHSRRALKFSRVHAFKVEITPSYPWVRSHIGFHPCEAVWQRGLRRCIHTEVYVHHHDRE